MLAELPNTKSMMKMLNRSHSTLPDYLVQSLVEIYESEPLGIDDSKDDSDTHAPDLPLVPRIMRGKHADISKEEAEEVVDLLQRILRYDPAERPTTAELLRHPYIVEFCQGGCNTPTQGPPPSKRRKLAEPLE
jgi:serine/threonine protein kinase